MKADVEARAGLALDDVRVHRNSAKPGKIGALAYAQGRDIHLAPGQERHLPHEAWHVVQQKQGRVRPTFHRMGIGINDDSRLEREADSFRTDASSSGAAPAAAARTGVSNQTVQRWIGYKTGWVKDEEHLRASLLTVLKGAGAKEAVEHYIKLYQDEPGHMTGKMVYEYTIHNITHDWNVRHPDRPLQVVRGTSVTDSAARHGPLLPTRANADAPDDAKAAMSSFNFSNVTLGRLTFWRDRSKGAASEGTVLHARQANENVHAEDSLIEQFDRYAAEQKVKTFSKAKVNLTINNFFCSPASTKKKREKCVHQPHHRVQAEIQVRIFSRLLQKPLRFPRCDGGSDPAAPGGKHLRLGVRP